MISLSLVLLASSRLVGAGSAVECDGLRVRLSAHAAAQGGVVLLEVEGPSPRGELAATWRGQPVRFWRDEDGGRRRALVGVDLEEPTRKAPLALSRGGEPACRVELEVKDGGFGETRLRVARGYVDLSPADRKRTRREAARLEKIFATASAERLWREPFRLPLDDADHADNFGQRRIFNDQPRSPHSGLDFPAETGTPVRATQRGRVALASALFYSGRTVILDHGLGLFTFYGHMSALDVAEGLLVDSGTVLGRVGKTGRATGPHLHWSARLNGARINPLELIALFPG